MVKGIIRVLFQLSVCSIMSFLIQEWTGRPDKKNIKINKIFLLGTVRYTAQNHGLPNVYK